MDRIEMRPMVDEDIPHVIGIEKRVFSTPWSVDMFRQEVRGVFGSRAIVVVMDKQIIGYVIAWFIEDEVHLVNIAVDEPFQSRGVGSIMINDLIDHALAERKRIITLEVRASNVDAQAFYRHFLFKAIGVRKGYYSDNREDAILMVLDLDNYSGRKRIREGRS